MVFSSFAELHRWQQDRGVVVSAVTEHDTLDGWQREGTVMANAQKPWVVPGVELSCEIRNVGIGILGIGFDVHDRNLRQFLSRETRLDMSELHEWTIRVRDLYQVDFARVMDGWARRIFPEFSERRVRYIPEWIRKRLLVEAGIAANSTDADRIHEFVVLQLPRRRAAVDPQRPRSRTCSGARLAFLEHPPDALHTKDVSELCAHGLDGLEVYSNHLTRERRRHWLEFCEGEGDPRCCRLRSSRNPRNVGEGR